MLRIFADNHNLALTLDYLALFANFFNRRSDFHLYPSFHVNNIYYLLRHVMRPLVRSYGDISIVTLSPGSMRMKFILSFPDIWALIVCPLGSSTTNWAFGNASLTVPSISITSCFDNLITSSYQYKTNPFQSACSLSSALNDTWKPQKWRWRTITAWLTA